MRITTDTQTTTLIDAEGNEQTTIVQKTRKIELCSEPDYIKLYTNMWCEFNEIPHSYRPLFMELVTRMTYCDKNDLNRSQVVYVGEPFSSAICKTLGWTHKDSLMKGLRSLTKCNAIKKISRGVYQINPQYAGRGEWKYNPRLDRGGIEDLVATFNFKDKTVSTKITWADNGNDNEVNRLMREGIGCKPQDQTVLSTTDVNKI